MARCPDVRVIARSAPVAGTDFDVDVLLDATRAIEVEGIEVTFRSEERVQYGRVALTHVHCVFETKLGSRELAAGTTTIPVRFALPASLVPSYEGWLATIEHVIGSTFGSRGGSIGTRASS